MTSVGPESEELLLGPRRPLFSRRGRIVALVLVAAGALTGLIAYVSSDSSDDRPTAASTSVPSSHEVVKGPPPPDQGSRPWPTARSACGGRTDLPLVRGTVPLRSPTHLSLLVGSSRLFRYDVDSGHLAPVRTQPHVSNEIVGWVTGPAPVYGITYNCNAFDEALPRLLRITSTGARAIPVRTRFDDLLVVGDRVWAARWPSGAGSHGSLVPVGGGPRVRLPVRFIPYGASGELLAGNLANQSDRPQPLVLVDARSGAIEANFGAGSLLAIDEQVLVWTTGCDIDEAHPCQLRRRVLSTGATTMYPLPRSPGYGPTALSSDHRLMAFTLERATTDPRFDNTHPFPPSEIAVLDLDTGSIATLPGVEIAAKSAPSLAFAADDRLVVALDAGTRIRVLLWRVGDATAGEARAIPGLAASPPALLVLPTSTRITDGDRNR